MCYHTNKVYSTQPLLFKKQLVPEGKAPALVASENGDCEDAESLDKDAGLDGVYLLHNEGETIGGVLVTGVMEPHLCGML